MEAMAGQIVDNLEQMKEPPCLRHITIVSYDIMEINTTPSVESRGRRTVETVSSVEKKLTSKQ